jgi:hypothetical protein
LLLPQQKFSSAILGAGHALVIDDDVKFNLYVK